MAKEFLERSEQRMPFKLEAIQVDGGSEFYSEFEEEGHRRKLRLFVIPQRAQSSMVVSNGHIGLIQRSFTKSMGVHGM
jgi:putative transposase